MRKIVFGILVSILMIGSILASATVVENNIKNTKTTFAPIFEAINIDETTIEIDVNPGEFEFGSIDTEGGMFATVSLSNFVFSLVEGEAKLPVIRKMIEIPQGSNPELTIDSISWEQTSLDDLNLPEMIIPAQFSVEKVPEPSDDFAFDVEYYSSSEFLPEVVAKIVETGEIRSRRFALVEISPIQYKPATGDLKLMTSCEITIDLPNSDLTQTYNKIQRYSTPSYEQILENTFSNYGFYEEGNLNRDQEGILIIVYDNFYDEIQPLANLKIVKGFDTTVTETSDIPGGPTKENIKAYIQDAYDNWNIPPSYVLLVGDTPQIPTYPGTTGPSAADLYYVTLDGSDFIPEIHIGRFPGSQDYHIAAMVDKTVYYELGSFPSDEWIKKAAFLASTDNWQISEGTHNYVIDNYLNPNGYTCDKLYTYTYGATTQQVSNAINDGRSLVIYSGHGGPTGWGDGPPFYQSNVQALTNENMYPFVCSHACSTNTFDQSECFGETWLRLEDKAALAFWGASASTYWDEDDILEKGMFQAWWDDGLEWIGGMTDMGLLYLYENYSGGGMTRYYFEAYNVNGDPSVRLWSDNPSQPPATPAKPNGPDEWTTGAAAIFTSSTTDPEDDSIYYMFDWGDETQSDWLGPYPSGQTVESEHVWADYGDYEVKVIARDIHNAQSEWSEVHIISIIPNSPPETPTLTGPTMIKAQVQGLFTITSTDPDGHDIYYYISWDDETNTGWDGPYSSGETVTFKHAWSVPGSYVVKAFAKDFIGDKSPQLSFNLQVLRSRSINNRAFIQILEKIINHFPLIKQILQK